MNVLIDTCVIIDVLQKREPFWEDAKDIFMAVANRKIRGFSRCIVCIYLFSYIQLIGG